MPLVPLRPMRVPRLSAAAQIAQTTVIPAPVGGLNYRDPIAAMAPQDALVLTNMIPRQQGVEMRKGWQQLTATAEESIESVFGYKAPNPSDDKQFAAFDGNIYDVTDGDFDEVAGPTGSTEDAWWTTQFSTPADTFLLAVSPGAGYWTYSTSTGWVDRTAAVTGLPINVRTVAVWKQRVWFTAEDDSQVYYLDTVNAISGACTSFPMGSILRSGGYVSAMLNWTIDAGYGIDDYLVVVGTEGDVGVWEGTDPTSAATFGLKGAWYVGPVPKYGQYFTPYGGDVFIVSELGLVPMSKLITGQYSQDNQSAGPASKIQPVFAPLVRKLRARKFFNVLVAPDSGVLIIKMPNDGGTYRQFAMNVTTGAWCEFTGIPMRCAAVIGGDLYFGTEDGFFCRGLYGDLDGVDDIGAGGNSIEGDVMTAFQHYGTPANNKKFSMARPIFIAPDAPSIKVIVNTQFQFDNVPGSPAFFESDVGIWDASRWNQASWAGNNTYQGWVGLAGLGYYGSLRMKVRGLPTTTFTASHMMMEQGGVM